MSKTRQTTKVVFFKLLEAVIGAKITANTLSITAGGAIKLNYSTANWDTGEYIVGRTIFVQGLAVGDFYAEIKAIANKDLTLINIKGTDGLDKTLTAESAGANGIVNVYKETAINGQTNSTIDMSADQIDATTKDDGTTKVNIAGMRETTGTLEGVVIYEATTKSPDPTIIKLKKAFESQATVRLRMNESESGQEYYEGKFSVLGSSVGGGVDDLNTYNFSLSASGAISYCIEV